MIACACGMSEWSVECEFVCRRNGWVNGQWMEWMWLCCTCFRLHRLKTELFSVAMRYIYTTIGVCERDERDDRDKEYPFRRLLSALAWMDQQDTNNQQRTSQQHYIWHHLTSQEPAVLSKVETAACLQSSNIITLWLQYESKQYHWCSALPNWSVQAYPMINLNLPRRARSTVVGTRWGSRGPKIPWGRIATVWKSAALAASTIWNTRDFS